MVLRLPLQVWSHRDASVPRLHVLCRRLHAYGPHDIASRARPCWCALSFALYVPAEGIAIGLGLGVIETSVWTGVAVVIPEISSGPAFSFLSAAISIVLVVAPYGAGFIHDYYHCAPRMLPSLAHTLAYDPVALMCAASAGIAWIASILLYFQAPELQNSTLKTYMTYVVAIHTTKKVLAPLASCRYLQS